MLNYRRQRNRYVTIRGTPFKGVVVNNNDPQKQERLQVRIPNLHNGISDSDLAWIRPQRDGHATSDQGNVGGIGPIPPVGSNVIVVYDDETMYYGYYSATLKQKNNIPKELVGSDTTGNNYPKVNAWIDPGGNRWNMDYKRNTVDVDLASGTHFSIDGKGHIGIRASDQGSGTAKNSSGLTIHVTGDISLVTENGDVNIGGQNINIVAQKEIQIGAQGNLKLTTSGVFTAPQAIPTNGPVPTIPALDPPTTRTAPNLQAPSDPTAAGTS